MLGTDDVSLGQLDGPRRHAVVPRVVGGGAADTVHQLLIVLHHGVLGVVTGACVTGVVRTVDTGIGQLVLGPDGVPGQTLGVIPLATARHLAPGGHHITGGVTHSTLMLTNGALVTPELLH